ncbi:MAG: NAD(P)-binding protein [Hyphomicrobiaceae bacterium]|nr:MAG: NAD(P)-binding protein [Hyphomicrobiaceae bacterium]
MAITRRDFLNGMALSVTAGFLPSRLMAADAPYPPALTGMRGLTDEAFKTIHGLALSGEKFDIDPLAPAESYDLIVVGAGLAGLTAAFAYRQRRPKARILILDNNDDFGGHARRTEHTVSGKLIIGYGGSESLVAPAVKFKGELARILAALAIEPKRFESEDVFHRRLYPGLGLKKAVFFNKEAFGVDKLVTGDPLQLGFDEFAPRNPGARKIPEFLADCPLSDKARAGLNELFEAKRDYLAGVSEADKVKRLEKKSYRAFLTEICGLPKDAADFFQGRSADNWGFGVDALGAMEMMADGYPGAKALKIEKRIAANAEEKAAYVHHFPDGNASLARALVRSLVRGAAPGRTMSDVVTAKFDYGRLDRETSLVRIRLNATAVAVRNGKDGVDVGYVKDGKLIRVKGRQAILAIYAAAMPHICPEVPKDRAELMRSAIRAPLVYSKVAIRNWQSLVKLKVHKIAAPMLFHSLVKLDYPVSLGGYKFSRDPAAPAVLHLVHVPTEPGQNLDQRDQARAGRARLLSTSFADFEKQIRSDLDRMLGAGGFDAKADITGITVNRWSHGYAYTPSNLFDDLKALEPKQKAMKEKIGQIAFASSDTGWDAYAHTAMEEAVRAVKELLGEAKRPVARKA